ncbi:MAG UNVERIFIED_CONTAM: hypothetical protein LVR29_31000 [Microcystis novacekii LVE1205-3]
MPGLPVPCTIKPVREILLSGNLWLPITVTSKGLEYGEVIGEGIIPTPTVSRLV